jgi:hypothetical protein
MSSFDSDNDFMHEEYYETNGNYYTNGIYQGKDFILFFIIKRLMMSILIN